VLQIKEGDVFVLAGTTTTVTTFTIWPAGSAAAKRFLEFEATQPKRMATLVSAPPAAATPGAMAPAATARIAAAPLAAAARGLGADGWAGEHRGSSKSRASDLQGVRDSRQQGKKRKQEDSNHSTPLTRKQPRLQETASACDQANPGPAVMKREAGSSTSQGTHTVRNEERHLVQEQRQGQQQKGKKGTNKRKRREERQEEEQQRREEQAEEEKQLIASRQRRSCWKECPKGSGLLAVAITSRTMSKRAVPLPGALKMCERLCRWWMVRACKW